MSSWEAYFSTNRGTISAISFLSFIVFAVSQPLVGKWIDHFGVRKIFVLGTLTVGAATLLSFFVTSIWQLFVLYGLVASIGFGAASGVTASVTVSKWFSKKQGLALGLVEAGFGAGQMVLVPSSIFLIEAFGWKWTVLILGSLLIFVVCPKLLSDYYKGQSVGLLTGWLFMSHQLGSALGSYLPGVLFDQTDSYQISFLFAIILLIAAGFFSALLPKVQTNHLS
ncbi:MFS transporter [Neobacillus sp. D3-1R]|uniref:MFS transporter n=1 Tax=Neobacillus sp. D3-1R TaxID=3445778 RepID=UPI003FA18E64